jgi:hypothetical protein
LTRARETAERQAQREAQRLQASTSMYNQLQSTINKLTAKYNDLAVRKALYNNLTDKEEEKLRRLQTNLSRYNETLRTVDAQIGRHTRNVGNYASGYDALGGSINQLTREMPAFANSVQTGFMAISNNLPIFFDAINQTRQRITQLRSEGQQVPGLFAQLTSSLFSWGTALSVGVTLLTIYGKEIANWVGSLFGAGNAMKELQKIQDEYNNSFDTGMKNSIQDVTRMREWIDVAKNRNITEQERLIALNELKDKYPFYLKNLDLEKGLTKENIGLVNNLSTALEKRARAEVLEKQIIENKKKLIDLERQFNKEQRESVESATYGADLIAKQTIKSLSEMSKSDALLTGGFDLSSLRSLSKEFIGIQKINKEAQIEANKLFAESIGLDLKEKKEREKKIKEIAELNIRQVNYLERENSLRKLVLENLIRNNKQAFDDERLSLDERGKAYENYLNFKKQLLLVEYENERVTISNEEKNTKDEILKQYNDQLDKIKKALADGTATRVDAENKRLQASKEKNEAILSLEKKITADRNILTETFVQKQKELNDEYTNDVLFKLIQNLDFLDKKIKEQKNTLSEKTYLNYDISELFDGKKLKVSLQEYDKFFKTVEQKASESEQNRIKSEIENIEDKMLYITEIESEEYKKLASEKLALEIELQNKITEERKKSAEEAKKIQEEIQNYFKSFVDTFAGQSGFTSIFKILRKEIKDFGEDTAVTALAVSEAFQEMYNFLNQGSEDRFRAELERNEQQKNIAIQFAGESTTAKEEIERQYEEKRKEIQRRQAQAAKEAALFNTIINTAQAVVSALASAPPNVPLSVTVGVIGAAQAAMIAARPLPEFWTGTENAPEGYAKTQERGREIITDSNNNIKSWGSDKGTRIDYLKKGDKVINAENTRKIIDQGMFMNSLNGLLLENTIGTIPFRVEQKNDNSGVISEIKALRGDLMNRQSSLIITRDKRGERTFEYKNGVKRELLNNSLKGIAKYVK